MKFRTHPSAPSIDEQSLFHPSQISEYSFGSENQNLLLLFQFVQRSPAVLFVLEHRFSNQKSHPGYK
ncbi:hypothetical protein H1Q63_26575 [Desmonostoc muscorum CCALA 125]|nr:hypothetical protein [Desmonostoc muscorum CCALA 125]